MAELRIHFTGMCLFTKRSSGNGVNVCFAEPDPGMPGDHHAHAAHHSPLLSIPAGVWLEDSESGGKYHKRRAGRPLHLGGFQRVYLRDKNNTAPTGAVSLKQSGGSPPDPATVDWVYLEYALSADKVFNTPRDPAVSDALPRFELNDGELRAARPQFPSGEKAWYFGDGSDEQYITDVLTYAWDPGDSCTIYLITKGLHQGPPNDVTIKIDTKTPVDLWVAHDPFEVRRQPKIFEHVKVKHLELLSPCYPKHGPIPEIITLPKLNPDSPTCPPVIDLL